MPMNYRPAFVLILTLLAAGCEQSQPAVGTLRVDPVQFDLAYPHYQELAIDLDMQQPLPDAASPLVMVHLLDASGEVVRTFDHELPRGWTPGDRQRYAINLYQSALAPPLEPGTYTLTTGIYDPQIGRFELTADGEQVHEGEYAVATVEAAQGSGDSPKFFFSPSWLATEVGTDVQTLGRRWLRGDGTLKLRGVGSPGQVRMHLRIEQTDEAVEDLVLSEGFEEPQLDVTTTCSEATWSFVGFGTHILELPVGPDSLGDDGECELSLTPHYQVVTRRNLSSRSLALDLLAWRAD